MMSGETNGLPDVKLFAMMDQLGLEPTGAPVPRFAHMLASAFHTCKTCESVVECRSWLAQAANGRSNGAPAFCLNGDLLAEFLFEPVMRKG